MARSIDLIRNGLVAALKSSAIAVGLPIVPENWSMTDYKLLILDTVASACGIEEQLWDAYSSDIDRKVALAAPETGLWWQNQLINVFQFNSSNPQVVNILPDFSIGYPNPNNSYKIIKYCSVNFITYGRIQLKVAAQVGGLPADVDTVYGAGTLDTVRSFVNTISDTSIIKVVRSGQSDKLFMQLDVYFNGIYAAVIQSNVISAINNFLQSIPFDGVFLLSKLETAILSVSGVNDCVLINIQARADTTPVGTGSNLVLNKTEIQRSWSTIAGYIIPENTTGANWTLTDYRVGSSGILNLNLIPQ